MRVKYNKINYTLKEIDSYINSKFKIKDLIKNKILLLLFLSMDIGEDKTLKILI